MITVVIFTYNHAQYLPTQLASIIRQGANVSKIIVVNDGSTDNTADILAKIQLNEPRLMVKNLPDNVGWMQAAHIGLRYVDTEFFSFAAADDFRMPDWAEKSLNALQSAPDIGMCICGKFTASETSAALFKSVFPKSLRGAVLTPMDFHRSVMRYGTWMESNTTLIRRSAYDEKYVEFASAGGFADGVINYALGLKSGAVLLDEPLGVFFEREASVSGGIIAPRVAVTQVQELSNVLRKTPCVELIDRRLASRIIRRNTYSYLMGSAHHLTSEFLQLAKGTLPPAASRALRITLRLLFILLRLMAFACLRPFDLMAIKKYSTRAATLDETRAISKYRKLLNDSLPSIGLDI